MCFVKGHGIRWFWVRDEEIGFSEHKNGAQMVNDRGDVPRNDDRTIRHPEKLVIANWQNRVRDRVKSGR